MDKIRQRRIDEIKKDLFASQDAIVLSALSQCEEYGDESLIQPLIATYAQSDNELIRNKIRDMLNSLKVSNTESAFITVLNDPSFRTLRSEIFAFMWNSGVQPVEHLAALTKMAIEGSFEEIFEIVTLVENMDSVIPEEEWLESITILKSFISTHPGDERKKVLTELLFEIQALKEMTD